MVEFCVYKNLSSGYDGKKARVLKWHRILKTKRRFDDPQKFIYFLDVILLETKEILWLPLRSGKSFFFPLKLVNPTTSSLLSSSASLDYKLNDLPFLKDLQSVYRYLTLYGSFFIRHRKYYIYKRKSIVTEDGISTIEVFTPPPKPRKYPKDDKYTLEYIEEQIDYWRSEARKFMDIFEKQDEEEVVRRSVDYVIPRLRSFLGRRAIRFKDPFITYLSSCKRESIHGHRSICKLERKIGKFTPEYLNDIQKQHQKEWSTLSPEELEEELKREAMELKLMREEEGIYKEMDDYDDIYYDFTKVLKDRKSVV